MNRISQAAALIFAAAIAISASSGAMARGGGHGMSPQHASGPAMSGGTSGGTATAAKSVNLGGLSKFVIKNAIVGGKMAAGALGSVGRAVSGPGKCSGGSCSGSPL